MVFRKWSTNTVIVLPEHVSQAMPLRLPGITPLGELAAVGLEVENIIERREDRKLTKLSSRCCEH